jgi:hypothetical protein
MPRDNGDSDVCLDISEIQAPEVAVIQEYWFTKTRNIYYDQCLQHKGHGSNQFRPE